MAAFLGWISGPLGCCVFMTSSSNARCVFTFFSSELNSAQLCPSKPPLLNSDNRPSPLATTPFWLPAKPLTVQEGGLPTVITKWVADEGHRPDAAGNLFLISFLPGQMLPILQDSGDDFPRNPALNCYVRKTPLSPVLFYSLFLPDGYLARFDLYFQLFVPEPTRVVFQHLCVFGSA